MSKVDENREYLSLASDGSAAVPIRVDPATGRLLVAIYSLAEAARTLNRSKVDENSEDVSKAINDDGDIVPLLIDSRNGYLLVDLLVE